MLPADWSWLHRSTQCSRKVYFELDLGSQSSSDLRMGMLVEGRWVGDVDKFIKDGAFVRAASAFDKDLPHSFADSIMSANCRYVLIASMS